MAFVNWSNSFLLCDKNIYVFYKAIKTPYFNFMQNGPSVPPTCTMDLGYRKSQRTNF